MTSEPFALATGSSGGAARTAETPAWARMPDDPGAERPRHQSAPAPLPPFEDVLAAHEVELYRYLRRFALTAEDAADLHQETFLRAFRAYGRLGPGANVRAWLYRIAGNLAHDAHRRRIAREPAGVWGPDAAGIAGIADGTAAQAEAAELREAVRASLLRLTTRQRLAVMARTLDGDEYADVAAALGCSEETARQHVSQGLRRMRTMLERWMEVEE